MRSNDPRIDPVGACVGMRGSRVQAVSNELAGERVDIILFDDNPAQFVINAHGARPRCSSIVVDEEVAQHGHRGRRGDSCRRRSAAAARTSASPSELTGWELNIMTEQAAEEKSEAEAARRCARCS
ncbi:MAG: hypothetical protein MZV65_33850 [Chromatiales bacterium]|nr:hypothetical protein [Chromatiales bacterium]